MFKSGWEGQAHADGETLKTKIVYLFQEKETAGPVSLSGRGLCVKNWLHKHQQAAG